MFRLFCASALVLFIAASAQVSAQAQDAAPPAGVETPPDYQATQDAIAKTRARVEQLRKDNDAREKEMEAITSKVTDAIATMSSQGEDTSTLRSEVSGLTDQLTTERQTSTGLRSDLDKVTQDRDAAQQKWTTREKQLQDQLRAAQDDSTESKKRLAAALDSIAEQARTNKQLTDDVANLEKELDQARKAADLRRRLNSTQPQNAPTSTPK